MRTKILATALIAGLFAGCDEDPATTAPTAASALSTAISVSGGGDSIRSLSLPASFVTDTSAQPAGAARAAAKAPESVRDYEFLWLFSLPSPTVGGKVVQASAIASRGSRTYIAYSDSGAPFNGAIQIVDPSRLSIDGSGSASVLNTIAFAGMDIHALLADGVSGRTYFAGAADPDRFSGNRALVGWIDPNNPTAEAIAATIRYLPSYAAVTLARDGQEILVGSGAAGGVISRLDKDLNVVSSEAAVDIRSLDLGVLQGNSDLIGALLGGGYGGAGELRWKLSGSWSRLSLPWFTAQDAKADLKVVRPTKHWGKEDGLLAGALSDRGFFLWMVTGGILDSIWSLPNPSGGAVSTANAVTWHGDAHDQLLFLANGEYGMRVIALDSLPSNSSSKLVPATPYAHVVGVLNAPEASGAGRASFNAVVYSPPFVMAAAGKQGVQFYWMK